MIRKLRLITKLKRPAAISVMLLLISLANGEVTGPPAQAQSMNRAGLVIQTDSGVRRLCVRFPEASISGAELLRRANVDAVFRSYSGNGAAVCALCGVGCPPDESCLTCGGSEYWTYARAPEGTSAFRYSQNGSSSAVVRNGDVEGWRWGSGQLPPYTPAATMCDPAAPPSTTTAVVKARPAARSTGSGPRPAPNPIPSAPTASVLGTTLLPTPSTPAPAVTAGPDAGVIKPADAQGRERTQALRNTPAPKSPAGGALWIAFTVAAISMVMVPVARKRRSGSTSKP